jgi:glycosyltransferase involved in cell wall biosynthesis
MPALFRSADALLVTLGTTPVLDATVPSKIQAYMQAGRPIIGALNGEGARIIRQADAGLTVPSGDGERLSQAILTLAGMSSNRRADLGQNARSYFLEHFEAEQAARNLVSILSARLRQKGRS